VTWDSYHSTSESLAVEAEAARRDGNHQRAEELYRRAAVEEAQALSELPLSKLRTRGITAVSAVALSYKAREFQAAERLAYQCLSGDQLPSFARAQLRELLEVIWNAQGAESAGIRFEPGDVLVSVKGGEIINGGAPLDLIIQKIESIQALLFRTVEMLLNRPLRKRGGPEFDIQSMFKPWLFQAPAGSYQFTVRVEEARQHELWERPDKPKVENVTTTFFRVLRATANDPEGELPAVVPNEQYRAAFLNLSRNLGPTPTRKTFERLEVRDAGAPGDLVASFAAETRQLLNEALRVYKPAKTLPTEETVTLQGTLRALHLDKDWLEIAITDPAANHIRIDRAGEVLDDVIGPMVNRRVMVTAVRHGRKYFYRDIELDD
jgi:hypothetical protein